MSVETWLAELGLERYAAAFEANDVTEDLLSSLTAEDLREIGITSVGHRRRLLDAIAARQPPAPDIDPQVQPAAMTPPPVLDHTPERRQVSVVFCDLVGSTALSARLDPEDLSAVIQTYQARVNEVVGRFGGFIARYLGDGVLIYFGWPMAREDDPERAVRASLDIVAAMGPEPVRGERLHVRIGIATGLVLIGERIGSGDSLQHTAIGETPNRAARLQTMASPDTVVIDATTRQMVGGLFEMRDLGARALAGLAGLTPAWTVIGESGVLSRFEARHGTALAPMVGRTQELGILMNGWRRARAGNGSAVLVTGEPGIGKSRLISAFDEQMAGESYTRLRYFCLPHRRDTPWGPFIGQIEHTAGFTRGDSPATKIARLRDVLVPGTPPEDVTLLAGVLSIPPDATLPVLDLPARRRRERTLAALLRQFTSLAHTRPLVVLVEDIQWADPSSLEALDQIVDLLPRLPVLLVLTYRPEFSAPWVGRAGVTSITLGRLPAAETAEIALRLAASAIPTALIERLVTRSDGIPLFIEELTRAVLEAGLSFDSPGAARVPDSLQASLLSRLDRLPAAKAAAQIGSVIGRSFHHDLAMAIAGPAEATLTEGLEQLVESGLAFRRGAPPDVTYQFKHALVQDTAYQSMVRPRRIALHAAVVAVLEREAHGEPGAGPRETHGDAALMAHHCAEAGLVAQAVKHFLAAGEQTMARGAMTEAHTLLTRGLRLADEAQDLPDRTAWRTRYYLALGEVLGAMRFFASTETGAALSQAASLARGMAPTDPARPQLLARALFGHFVHGLYLGEFRTIRLLSDELLALGRELSHPGIGILGAIANGICRVYQGEFIAARAIFHDGLERWRQIDRPETARAVADALGMEPISILLAFRARQDVLLGLPDTGVADALEAVTRARKIGHPRSYAVVLGIAWDAFGMAGDEDKLRRATIEWDRMATEQGFQFYLTRARYCGGWMKVRDGDAIDGLPMLEDAARELDMGGVVLDAPQVHAMLADARVSVGDTVGALAAVDRGLEIAESSGGIWWTSELLLRRALLGVNGPASAEADFRRALAAARERPSPMQELPAATAYAKFLADAGRLAEARDILAPLLATFTQGLDRPVARAAAALVCDIAAAEAA